MHTPAHMIFAAAALARPPQRADPGGALRNLAALVGGFAPDLSLYVMVAWQRFAVGHDWRRIFEHDYRDAFWQGIFAIDNSIPLWSALLIAGLALERRALAVFAAAGLLHLAFDLPLHNSDARPHFWPVSDWVFHSPVSYWEPSRFGWLVAPIEVAACAALSVLLWRRFRSAGARALILAGMAAQAAPYVAFAALSGG
ncbi:cobalamin biosynthesis protein CobQ [Oceanicella actignis]|uniref:cobalamin biosynthesis protein CobQ n=1 Tax=Oceanicella actignis TaxID=1189325 RepID=UPI0011E64FAC|nr:cobalamin biosynthesis protein CobQ [Oceanicella actignis]TYO84817.1 hypothetical protein LY05_02790 [Oceanicella actignis]